MIIKTTKHIINKSNINKINQLDNLFILYKKDLALYINYIISGGLPLKNNLSSKILPVINITHSRYKQLIYKHASSIIRSQIDKANKKRYNTYKKLYSYFKKNNRQQNFINKKFKELNINNILYTKYFTKPDLKNISINLDERFFDIKKSTHFNNFIKIILPIFNDKGTRALNVKLPFNNHKHSNSIKSKGYNLKKNVQLKKINNNYYINLIWYKEKTLIKTDGKSLGIDMGYKKLITCSNGLMYNGNLNNIYTRISNKKQGSNNFKKSLKYRNNEINRICNLIDLSDINYLIIEDLKNVKQNKKYYNNKIQRWCYSKIINKLERLCEELGIYIEKVSPAYTSQTCSSCGFKHKDNRLNELFKCLNCEYTNDADINAAINIHNKGSYSTSIKQNKFIISHNNL